MKALIFPCILIIGAFVIYLYSSRQKAKHKKINWKIVSIIVVVVIVLMGFGGYKMYQAAIAPDTQCRVNHIATSRPPVNLTSAMDYFTLGNYDYDTGNCKKAITDYTTSIQLNPNYPQAYNNRAYTSMRMQDYKAALPDLDKALTLNPNYLEALMNRGDIHNYYYAIDRQSAIADYKKVVVLRGTHNTSVCGHLFLAKHNGWNLGTILDFPLGAFRSCD